MQTNRGVMEFLPGVSLEDLQGLCDDLSLIAAGGRLAADPVVLQAHRAELLSVTGLAVVPSLSELVVPSPELLAAVSDAGLELRDLWAAADFPLPEWAVVFDALDVLTALDELAFEAVDGAVSAEQVAERVTALFATTGGVMSNVREASGVVLDGLLVGVAAVSVALRSDS